MFIDCDFVGLNIVAIGNQRCSCHAMVISDFGRLKLSIYEGFLNLFLTNVNWVNSSFFIFSDGFMYEFRIHTFFRRLG